MAERRARGPLAGWVRRGGAAFAVVMVLSSCDVRAELRVSLTEDGSGTVSLAVGVDERTAAVHPDLLEGIVVDDLLERGWTVVGPTADPPGMDPGPEARRWLHLSHVFGSADELRTRLSDLFGRDRVVVDAEIERRDRFDRTVHRVALTVEVPEDLAEWSRDQAVEEVLGTGADALLADVFGPPEGWTASFDAVLGLPGTAGNDVRTNGSVTRDGSVRWRLEPGATTELWVQASTEPVDRTRWVGVGVVAAMGAVVAGGLGIRRFRQGRRARPGPGHRAGRAG